MSSGRERGPRSLPLRPNVAAEPGYPARRFWRRARRVCAATALVLAACGPRMPGGRGVARPAPVEPVAQGPFDRDADGLDDDEDLCPEMAEDRDQFEDEDGCPDADNDQDSLADAADQCPNEPETWNGRDDEDGCPDRSAGVVILASPIRILDRVYYVRGDRAAPAAARPILDAIAATLLGNPQIRAVEIQAHSDERGGDAANLAATRRFAEAVRQYLVDHGVEPERLRAVGVGERCPAAAGHTEDARRENRRVEFRIVEGDGIEPEASLPCEAARDLAPR